MVLQAALFVHGTFEDGWPKVFIGGKDDKVWVILEVLNQTAARREQVMAPMLMGLVGLDLCLDGGAKSEEGCFQGGLAFGGSQLLGMHSFGLKSSVSSVRESLQWHLRRMSLVRRRMVSSKWGLGRGFCGQNLRPCHKSCLMPGGGVRTVQRL